MPRTPSTFRLAAPLIALGALLVLGAAVVRGQSPSDLGLPRALRALFPTKWEYVTVHANKLMIRQRAIDQEQPAGASPPTPGAAGRRAA